MEKVAAELLIDIIQSGFYNVLDTGFLILRIVKKNCPIFMLAIHFHLMLKERVLKQFGKLEENREVLINFLDKSNGESMKFRPSPEKWNTLQIIFHLINAERNSVVYISKKKLGGTSVPKATWFNSLKSSWLTFSLLFLKTKAPKVLSEPPPELDYLQLKEEWNSVRIKMRELLIELPEDMLSRTIFRQPFAGYLNMPQALRFMQDHFKHHRKQIIQRIKMSA